MSRFTVYHMNVIGRVLQLILGILAIMTLFGEKPINTIGFILGIYFVAFITQKVCQHLTGDKLKI